MDPETSGETNWSVSSLHTGLKWAITVSCIIGIVFAIVVGFLSVNNFQLDWTIVEILTAAVIGLTLGLLMMLVVNIKRIGFPKNWESPDARIFIDWYLAPVHLAKKGSTIEKRFPEATCQIIHPKEIIISKVVDLILWDIGKGSIESGILFYMDDKSVINTSGLGLASSKDIAKIVIGWHLENKPESALALKYKHWKAEAEPKAQSKEGISP